MICGPTLWRRSLYEVEQLGERARAVWDYTASLGWAKTGKASWGGRTYTGRRTQRNVQREVLRRFWISTLKLHRSFVIYSNMQHRANRWVVSAVRQVFYQPTYIAVSG